MRTESKKYFRLERLCLKYGGVSIEGSESWMYKAYSTIVLVFFVGLYPVLLIIDLIKQGKFNESIAGWYYALAILMDGSIIIYSYFVRKQLGQLIRKLESGLFVPNKNRGAKDEENVLLNAWLSFYKRQGMVLLFTSVITVLVPVTFTITKRITTSDYHDWKLAWGTITFIDVTYSPNFELVWLYQNVVIFYIAINMIPLILVIIGVLALLIVQLQMLHAYLKRLVELSRKEVGAKHLLSFHQHPKIWSKFHFHVKNAVMYHLNITNIAEEVESVFRGPFLILFMVTLVLLCLDVQRASLIPILDVRVLFIFVELVTAFFPVLMVCYYGEELAYTSGQVSDIAFEIDFVGTDTRFQKSLIMIIRRSQKIIRMKAGGLVEISMNTMVWILRTSFSVYMMLRTLNTSDDHF